ncbi:MAG: hypothetical protein AAF682_15055 [Planctomycetota bacterium]
MPSLVLCLKLAGLGQLVLALASLAIPRVLGWREETRRLSPLTREVFWTYAVYIWVTNVALGLTSLLLAEELASRAPLARAVTAYALVYWGVRLALQLLSFGKHAPPGRRFKVAEALLVQLFVFLSAVYAWATFT